METTTPQEIETPPSKRNPLLFLVIAIVILFALMSMLFGWMYFTNDTDSALDTEDSTLTETPVSSTSTSGEPIYITQKLNVDCSSIQTDKCDLRLIRVNADGSSKIIVDNLTDLFMKSASSSHQVEGLYLKGDSENLIFTTYVASSACCSLYTFDLPTKTFERLQNGRYSDFYGDVLSPNNSKMLRISEDGKSLHVTDLLTDVDTVIAEAGDGETFIEYRLSYGAEPRGNYRWLNNESIRYSVYDETEEVILDESRTAVDTKTVQLQD